MAYQIVQFGEILIPDELQEGDEQNMGTGEALTSFQQVPGGVWFDNYGSERSPKGIQPITRSGIISADTVAGLVAEMDALRQNLGVRERLTIRLDDGSLRWNWARLKTANLPRPSKAKGGWLPYTLQWVTADQFWRGVVASLEAWSVGDDSFRLGDGTTSIGESGTQETLTSSGTAQAFTIAQDGNMEAEAVAVTIGAGTSAIAAFTYANLTTQRSLVVAIAIGVGEKLVINGAALSVRLFGATASITAISNTNSITTTVTTGTVHGLVAGDNVEISGGTAWDGIHEVLTVPTTSSLTFGSRVAATGSSGLVREVTDKFADYWTANKIWPTLAAGDNSIQINVTSGNTVADATVGWEYYRQYA